ncbi:MAG: ribosome biogenesis GTPase Der [Hyphomicrobiales bacterium]
MSGIVVIVGRPNVGKSTLFNRLAGRKLALVDDRPGVTRDRREGEGRLGDMTFTVVDTAGLEEAGAGTLEGRMVEQTQRAIAQSDLCLFLIDARAGLTPLDQHFSRLLHQSGKPVILVANKCENRAANDTISELFALGFDDPVALSAEHGKGMGALYDALKPHLGEAPAGLGHAIDRSGAKDNGGSLRLAVVGRPNTGKSTLINALLGTERVLAGPRAGVTRDAIAIDWQWNGRAIRLYDTAGLRRRSRVDRKLEKLAVADTLCAVRFAEGVVLLIDAMQPFEKQDLHIAARIEREGRACVIALNKWDLVADKDAMRARLDEMANRLLPQLSGVPVIPLSALTGENIAALIPAVLQVYEVWQKRIVTAKLNRWLADMVQNHPPPAPGGQRVKLRYMTQSKSRPPTFVFFCSRPELLPAAYRRYLVNGLRRRFDLWGIPVRVILRKGDNPYIRDKP